MSYTGRDAGMPSGDDVFDRLRAAIDALAAAEAADLLSEARIEAQARVHSTLTDALSQSMLEHMNALLPEPAPFPLGEFVALVEQLDDRLEDVELECTGPWPPYSFTQGTPD
jgi:Gas vesicle synthesis protein GvpL/GvpF